MLSKTELIERLQQYMTLKNAETPICALYLFGSYAAGRATSLSDIDLAILLEQAEPRENYFKYRLNLMAEFSSQLGTEKVDVIILNDATPDLAYYIIKDGQLLFKRPEKRGQLVAFIARTYDRYFDYLPAKKLFSAALIQRIKEGRFGG
jgi:predicted nucleotidyltransferase